MRKHTNFTVIGAGNGGKAMAAHLSIMGAKVTLYNRTWMHISAIKERGGIAITSDSGEVHGFGELANITSNIEEAVHNSSVIMVVVPAFAHKDVAICMSPYLRDGQIVILNPGRTFGAIEFKQMLEKTGCPADVIVAETQTFIYASRSDGPAQARIHRIKEGVPLAALPSSNTKFVLDALHPYYPQFIDGRTVLHTGLNNIGAIFHPAITMHNAGRIEDTGGEFQFYLDGVTPTVARIMEAMDRERIAIANAINVDVYTAQEWLKMAYDASGNDLYEAIHNQQGYRGIKAPATINHRYINEDIPMSLVPMASLGMNLDINVRAMLSVIRLACIAREKDYWKTGRTLKNLGIANYDLRQLMSNVKGHRENLPLDDSLVTPTYIGPN